MAHQLRWQAILDESLENVEDLARAHFGMPPAIGVFE